MPFRIVQSRQNARLKELRRAFAAPPRQAGGLAGIEGPNLLGEALRAGLRIPAVFVAQGSERLLDEFRLGPETEVLALPRELLSSALTTETPQPIAALIEAPQWTWERLIGPAKSATPLVVVLAGLQDPGNLGTILRSAEAFGASGVVSLPGTVSAWNPKAVRASAGSVFRVPLLAASAEDCFENLRKAGVRILTTAASDAQSTSQRADTNSVQADTKSDQADAKSERVDTKSEWADAKSERADAKSRTESGHDFSRAERVPKYRGASAPEAPEPAHLADLAAPVSILIGNEGNGVSRELAAQADGSVMIPCPGPVESLNAAVAASILLYEASRQRSGLASAKPLKGARR
jgi:RNA methyltransferase, TrmH family